MEQRKARFAHYLRKVIRSNDVDAMRVATKALGRLAIPGGTLTFEFIEFEVKRALEWFQSYLGCIAGSESYGSERCHGCVACLLEDYLPQLRQQWYSKIYEEAQKGFRIGSADAIHGSLLVYRELFEQAGTFMQKYYNDVCETVLEYKDHRDNLVRRTVLVMMLNLASYNPNDFASKTVNEIKCSIGKKPFPQRLDTESHKKYAVSGIDEASEAKAPDKKLPVNQQHLKAAWETSQKSTRDDWQEWIRRLSVELLKESPSHALRACAQLYDQYQDELVRAIKTALMSPKISPEILQTLLNLAEFMEHDNKALPMDIRTLGQYAIRCHAYAKALHYKELEFIQEPTTPTIESLISINNQLQQNDAAVGIFEACSTASRFAAEGDMVRKVAEMGRCVRGV
ncbi:armadillo-type protein [Lipomyces starkeyi]